MAATGIGSGSGGSALVPSPVPKSLPSSQFQRLLTSVSDVLQAQWVPIAPLISLICEYSFFSGRVRKIDNSVCGPGISVSPYRATDSVLIMAMGQPASIYHSETGTFQEIVSDSAMEDCTSTISHAVVLNPRTAPPNNSNRNSTKTGKPAPRGGRKSGSGANRRPHTGRQQQPKLLVVASGGLFEFETGPDSLQFEPIRLLYTCEYARCVIANSAGDVAYFADSTRILRIDLATRKTKRMVDNSSGIAALCWDRSTAASNHKPGTTLTPQQQQVEAAASAGALCDESIMFYATDHGVYRLNVMTGANSAVKTDPVAVDGDTKVPDHFVLHGIDSLSNGLLIVSGDDCRLWVLHPGTGRIGVLVNRRGGTHVWDGEAVEEASIDNCATVCVFDQERKVLICGWEFGPLQEMTLPDSFDAKLFS